MSETERKPRVGLGVCGGIAAYKAIEVLRLLQKAGCDVSVAMTRHATEFVKPLTFRALTGEYVIVDDYDEANPDPIAHVNFSQNIDLLLVVPATANVLAKFANGIADDFLTSTYLASTAPVLVAPAMNVSMWEKPSTQRNIELLRADNVKFAEPISGELACKTVGTGKLDDVENIAKQAFAILGIRPRSVSTGTHVDDLSNEHILVTVGGTREAIDPVRFISNHSSGKMGFALAEAARDRGAWVTCVTGSVTAEPPEGVEVVRVESAQQMLNSVMTYLSGATVFVGAAAVADYRPKIVADAKIKKTDAEELTLELERTPDILSTVSDVR
ncbi:MAG TPA: bifunctional phosphopantothenoylcysteine decarboxylase/phosphopantothenate--cysteine ligase CoaBC, partial [Pyrinomonadaceae bacterium]|nr:bifunctional phosphopantothenoylcysteine decarboxylase/phosphopantothenate--cysteine ligase CoaBC [Pyrinomonadaceae bacterium]